MSNPTSKNWDQIFRENADAGAIDPNDKRGYKNRYIKELRDSLFADWYERLFSSKESPKIIDFGCGSGLSSRPLIEKGASVIGLDIAYEGLSLAPKVSNFFPVLIDGTGVPIADSKTDGAVSYVSLSYIEDDIALLNVLKQLHRASKIGAQFLFIEQSARQRQAIPSQHKVIRTLPQWKTVIESAGFQVRNISTLRCGHTPYLSLLKYGVIKRIPPSLGNRLEKFFEPFLSRRRSGYLEIAMELTKPENFTTQ